MEEGDETPSAELFHRLVRDGRNHSELRTAFSVLQSYLQASGSVWFDRGSQSGVQRASHDLAQELNLSGRGRSDSRLRGNDQERHVRPAALARESRWGIVTRGAIVPMLSTICGRPTSTITFGFNSSMPRRAVAVRLEKKGKRCS